MAFEWHPSEWGIPKGRKRESKILAIGKQRTPQKRYVVFLRQDLGKKEEELEINILKMFRAELRERQDTYKAGSQRGFLKAKKQRD